MVLENFVRLVPNQPKRLKLRNPRIEERQIHDPKTRQLKTVRALVFDCFEEDGVPTFKQFSTLSEKLATILLTLCERRARDYIYVEITWRPRDYATEYEVVQLE